MSEIDYILRKIKSYQFSVIYASGGREFQWDFNSLFIYLEFSEAFLVINIFIWVCLGFWEFTTVYSK